MAYFEVDPSSLSSVLDGSRETRSSKFEWKVPSEDFSK